MTDAPQFPAGWYADPENPTVHRWWDGYRWTEARQPAYGVPPQPSAYPAQPAVAPAPRESAVVLPPEPVAPVEPAAPVAPPQAFAAAPPLPPLPSYPATSAHPVTSAAPVVAHGVPTNTPWIWLVVLLPLLTLPTLFLLDWRGYLEDVVSESVSPSGGAQTWALTWSLGSLGITLLGYAVVAAQIVFAYLDWRVLRRRGVDRPFHWAWIFLALVVSNGVYVIGRGVILRKRTGSGLAPVWVWIAVTVLSWIVAISFAVFLLNEVFALLAHEGLLR